MSTTRLSPAAEFHLALMDPEVRQYAHVAPVSYIADLYPIGNRTAPDYARLILDHAEAWLALNTRSGRGAQTVLDPDAREWVMAHVERMQIYFDTLGTNATNFGQEDVYELLYAALGAKYRIRADQRRRLTATLASIIWLKYAIYGTPLDDERIRLAGLVWDYTATR